MAAGYACLLIGLGIGWLTGLSVTPVVQSVLGAVLALVGTLVAALAGLQPDNRPKLPKVSPWPLAALVLGIALAAPAGVFVRTHGWLGDRTEAPTPARERSAPSTGEVGLYWSPAPADCQLLRRADSTELQRAFSTAGDKTLRLIGAHVQNVDALLAIRDEMCRPQ
jgi:hypothetical protein